MIIREATKKDLEIIAKIAVEGEIDEEKLQYPNKTKAQISGYINPDIFRKILLKELNEKNRYFVVVEIDNEIVGFGQALIKKNIGKIGRVYINKEFRSKGMGTKLMRHLIDFLKKKKIKEIVSYVYTRNKPSLGLHQKLGFEKEAYKLVLKLK
jgi:L-amino acid N-acyltransferase YncA